MDVSHQQGFQRSVDAAFANIPPMPQRVRRSAFSPFLYRYRNLIERFFNKLKHFRAVATRYDKRDDNFLASVQLASIRIWLRHNESVTWYCIKQCPSSATSAAAGRRSTDHQFYRAFSLKARDVGRPRFNGHLAQCWPIRVDHGALDSISPAVSARSKIARHREHIVFAK